VNVNKVITKAPAHPCLLQHYSQQLSCGSSQVALLLMNGLRKCDIYKQWNFTRIKKNEILPLAGKWMELENIILSEVSQAQKAKSCMFSYMWNIDLIQIQQYYVKLVTLRGGHMEEG
jgi:hypothetical protein